MKRLTKTFENNFRQLISMGFTIFQLGLGKISSKTSKSGIAKTTDVPWPVERRALLQVCWICSSGVPAMPPENNCSQLSKNIGKWSRRERRAEKKRVPCPLLLEPWSSNLAKFRYIRHSLCIRYYTRRYWRSRFYS